MAVHTTPQEYDLVLKHTATNSVLAGTVTLDLAEKGWKIVNPFDQLFKYSESAIPEAEGSQPLVDGKIAAVDMMMVSQYYADDPDELQDDISTIQEYLQDFNAELNKAYVELSLWNGSALQVRRRYCTVIPSTFPMQEKLRYAVTSQVALTMRCYDPGLYGSTIQTEIITVTAGSGTSGAITPLGKRVTKRVYYQITKNSADNPTNVTITTNDGTFTMTGSLTEASDYWLIECVPGTVIFHDQSAGTDTDDVSKFSGQWTGITNGSDTITVVDTASSAFQVAVFYVDRYQ